MLEWPMYHKTQKLKLQSPHLHVSHKEIRARLWFFYFNKEGSTQYTNSWLHESCPTQCGASGGPLHLTPRMILWDLIQWRAPVAKSMAVPVCRLAPLWSGILFLPLDLYPSLPSSFPPSNIQFCLSPLIAFLWVSLSLTPWVWNKAVGLSGNCSFH